jgi:ABC-2 type transport system permease protein
MKRALIIAGRIMRQLRHDRRLLLLSILAPLVIIYFLKVFFDSIHLPPFIPKSRYVVPVTAFIVHFISFVTCTILLVQERRAGTLERLIISGVTRLEIIAGFLLGYFALVTFQTAIIQAEAFWLFKLKFSAQTILILFAVTWLLSIVSVLLGIFISTFARNEGQIFPFIPLIIVPSVFLSGMIIDVAQLPKWAQVLSRIFPLYYANNVIQQLIGDDPVPFIIIINFYALAGYVVVLLLLAANTFKDTE